MILKSASTDHETLSEQLTKHSNANAVPPPTIPKPSTPRLHTAPNRPPRYRPILLPVFLPPTDTMSPPNAARQTHTRAETFSFAGRSRVEYQYSRLVIRV